MPAERAWMLAALLFLSGQEVHDSAGDEIASSFVRYYSAKVEYLRKLVPWSSAFAKFSAEESDRGSSSVWDPNREDIVEDVRVLWHDKETALLVARPRSSEGNTGVGQRVVVMEADVAGNWRVAYDRPMNDRGVGFARSPFHARDATEDAQTKAAFDSYFKRLPVPSWYLTTASPVTYDSVYCRIVAASDSMSLTLAGATRHQVSDSSSCIEIAQPCKFVAFLTRDGNTGWNVADAVEYR